MQYIETKRWIVVFRALANINRLQIITMLVGGRELNVKSIARNLHISFTATSNHLALLRNLDVVEAHGKAEHVFYSLNPNLPKDFKKVIDVLLAFK